VLVLAYVLAASQVAALSLLLATGIVLACAVLARRIVLVTVEKGQLRIGVSNGNTRSAFTHAHRRPTRASAASAAQLPSPGDAASAAAAVAAAWQEVLGVAPEAGAAAEALVDRLVSDFITELWYKHLTPDGQFPGEVRALLLRLFAALSPRLRAVNVGALVLRDTCDVVAEQLELYRRVLDSVGRDAATALPAEALDNAFASELASDGDLLYAASGPDAEQSVLRRVADAMCGLLMPPHDKECPLVRSLARELLANCVLRPLVGFAAPFWMNKLLLASMRRVAKHRADGTMKPVGTMQRSPSGETLLRLESDSHGLWNADIVLDDDPAAVARLLAGDATEGDEDDQRGSWGRGNGTRVNAAHGGVDAPTQQQQRRSASMPAPTAQAPPQFASGATSRPLRAAGCLTARVTGSCVVQHSNGSVSGGDGGDRAWIGGSGSGGTHVSYSISVADAGAVPPLSWVVHRRFSQFEQLHKRVKALRARGRYKLPPKRLIFHGNDGSFMDERRQLLDTYLREMLADPRLAASPEVADFLAQDSRDYVDSREGGRAVAQHGNSFAAGSSAGLSSLQRSTRSDGHSSTAFDDDGSSTLSDVASASQQAAHDDGINGDMGAHAPRGMAAPAGGLSLPLLDLVDCIFRLRARGLVRRRMLSFARALVDLLLGSAVDEALAQKLAQLRTDSTVAATLRLVLDSLWPDGVWHRTKAAADAAAQGRPPPVVGPPGFGGVPLGREAEASADAAAVRALLFGGAPGAAERLIGADAYARGCAEVHGMLQSPVFVRQIGHNLLEAILAAAMPELHSVLWEVRIIGGGGHHASRRE